MSLKKNHLPCGLRQGFDRCFVQRTSRTFPAGAGHSYTWKGDGQIESETRPDTSIATITYDTRGFPSVVNWSNKTNTPDVTIAFDNAGRLTSAGNTAGGQRSS